LALAALVLVVFGAYVSYPPCPSRDIVIEDCLRGWEAVVGAGCKFGQAAIFGEKFWGITP